MEINIRRVYTKIRTRSAPALRLEALGGVAGDVALQWLARGGVYLPTGMAAHLTAQADRAPFLAAFRPEREFVFF